MYFIKIDRNQLGGFLGASPDKYGGNNGQSMVYGVCDVWICNWWNGTELNDFD